MREDKNPEAETMRFLRDTSELFEISPRANRTSRSICSSFSLVDWWKSVTRNRRARRVAKKLSRTPPHDAEQVMQTLERAVWFQGRMWVVEEQFARVRILGTG